MPPLRPPASERAVGERVRVGDGPRHGLPERSGASLRALLREGMTRPGKDRAGAGQPPDPPSAKSSATTPIKAQDDRMRPTWIPGGARARVVAEDGVTHPDQVMRGHRGRVDDVGI